MTFKNKKYEIPIFMYHRIIKQQEEEGIYGTYVYEKELEKQFNYIKDKGYTPIVFEDIEKGILEKNSKYVVLTFDDGYLDNYTILFPMLKKYSFKAVIYPVTGERYNRWDCERVAGAEKKLQLMNWEQMREMSESGVIEFGGHTVTHCNLNEISENEAKTEIKKCKEELEEKLEKKILSFAYPYGFFNEKHEKMVEETGYKYGIATDSGTADFFENLYHIRRIGIFSKDDIKKYEKKIKGNYNSIKIRRERLKEFRRKIKKILGWKK